MGDYESPKENLQESELEVQTLRQSDQKFQAQLKNVELESQLKVAVQESVISQKLNDF